MATTPAPNPRASLLSGLRTGGVRSTSGPTHNFPHSAAPGASFNVPRFASQAYNNNNSNNYYPDESDELADMLAQNMYIQSAAPRMHQPPMTAAVDGINRFSQQQYSRAMPNTMGMQQAAEAQRQAQQAQAQAQAQAQQQALQMQMLQLEMMRLQALQNQQYQAELLAQAQRQQQQQQQQQSVRNYANPPATAGPTSSFDIRSAAMNAQLRRANQADQLRTQLGLASDEQHMPKTAALSGKFGVRGTGYGSDEDFTSNNNQNGSRNGAYQVPSATTVISGGTSLGTPTVATTPILGGNNSNSGSPVVGPSKSDAAVSWRRGGNNNSVLNGANRPSVKITPPPSDASSPPPSTAVSPLRTRPQPLHFSAAISQPMSNVAIDESADEGDESSVTSSSKSAASSGQSPTTPDSASSSTASADQQSLSPREEAAKKLYEGLGIGRPLPGGAGAVNGNGNGAGAGAVGMGRLGSVSATIQNGAGATQRVMSSQPMRQPRGPPSGADELGPRNFATRIRRKAIGGLGALMASARERREISIEAF